MMKLVGQTKILFSYLIQIITIATAIKIKIKIILQFTVKQILIQIM